MMGVWKPHDGSVGTKSGSRKRVLGSVLQKRKKSEESRQKYDEYVDIRRTWDNQVFRQKGFLQRSHIKIEHR